MRKNWPLLLLTGAAAVYVWRKYQLSTKTRLIFRRINLAGSGLKRKLQLVFDLMNPTASSGTINSIDGAVYVNDKLVGNFYNYTPQIVEPRASTEVRVTVQLALGLISMLTSGELLQKGMRVNIEGNIVLDGISAPFNYTGKI